MTEPRVTKEVTLPHSTGGTVRREKKGESEMRRESLWRETVMASRREDQQVQQRVMKKRKTGGVRKEEALVHVGAVKNARGKEQNERAAAQKLGSERHARTKRRRVKRPWRERGGGGKNTVPTSPRKIPTKRRRGLPLQDDQKG